jgi:hypothetical protein
VGSGDNEGGTADVACSLRCSFGETSDDEDAPGMRTWDDNEDKVVSVAVSIQRSPELLTEVRPTATVDGEEGDGMVQLTSSSSPAPSSW